MSSGGGDAELIDQMSRSFAGALAEAAVAMPDSHGEHFAALLATCQTPNQAWEVVKSPPVAPFTTAASKVVQAWEQLQPYQALTGMQVSVSFRAAMAAALAERDRAGAELVWTGPDTQIIHARPTSEVVIEVVGQAKRDLLLVSFATSKVPGLVAALRVAAARGVNISLLAETAAAAGGQYHDAAQQPFPDVPMTSYVWAPHHRPTVGGHTAVMHAKVVLADDQVAFITSANLTGRAMDHNMEAGVLITCGPIPASLFGHFRELAYRQIIVAE